MTKEEAIEIVRNNWPDGRVLLKSALEVLIPELKENEDESVRKHLIDFVEQYGDNYYGQIAKASAIAWLEKQGKQANPYSGVSFEYNGHIWGMCARDNGVDILLDKQLFEHLEKQGEQKPVEWSNKDEIIKKGIINVLKEINEHIGRNYVLVDDKKIDNSEIFTWLQKQGKQNSTWSEEDAKMFGCALDMIEWYSGQNESKSRAVSDWLKSLKERIKGEQKSANNVEPKFKVGDWFVNNITNEAFLVKNFNDGIYMLEDTQGNPLPPYEFIAHPWTINDAKDGDVLCYEDEIFILKDYTLFFAITYHCCYDGKNFIPHGIYSLTMNDFNKIHPATKEQRDLLFQKMKEAGYEWDKERNV